MFTVYDNGNNPMKEGGINDIREELAAILYVSFLASIFELFCLMLSHIKKQSVVFLAIQM